MVATTSGRGTVTVIKGTKSEREAATKKVIEAHKKELSRLKSIRRGGKRQTGDTSTVSTLKEDIAKATEPEVETRRAEVIAKPKAAPKQTTAQQIARAEQRDLPLVGVDVSKSIAFQSQAGTFEGLTPKVSPMQQFQASRRAGVGVYASGVGSFERLEERIGEKRLFVKGKKGAKVAAVQFAAGAATSVIGTGRFAKSVITSPVSTAKGVVVGAYKFGAGFTTGQSQAKLKKLYTVAKTEPAFALGFVSTEIGTAKVGTKGLSKVSVKGSKGLKKIQRFRVERRFTKKLPVATEKTPFQVSQTQKIPAPSRAQFQAAAKAKLPLRQEFAELSAREAQTTLTPTRFKTTGAIVEGKNGFALQTVQTPAPRFGVEKALEPKFLKELGRVKPEAVAKLAPSERASFLASRGQTQLTGVKPVDPITSARLSRLSQPATSRAFQPVLQSDFGKPRIPTAPTPTPKKPFSLFPGKKAQQTFQPRTEFKRPTPEFKPTATPEIKTSFPVSPVKTSTPVFGVGLLGLKTRPLKDQPGLTLVSEPKIKEKPIAKTKIKPISDTRVLPSTGAVLQPKGTIKGGLILGGKTIPDTKQRTRPQLKQDLKPEFKKPVQLKQPKLPKARKFTRGFKKPKETKPIIKPIEYLPEDRERREEQPKAKKKKKQGFIVTPTLFAAVRGIKLVEPKKATKTGFTVRGI